MTVRVGLIACVVVGVAVLLVGERLEKKRMALVSKSIASACFCALGLAEGALSAGTFGKWILAGLVLGAGGDVALALPGEKPFLVGLGLFLGGHVAYVVACASKASIASWVAPAALVPLAASSAALAWLLRYVGPMKVPVVAYVVTITAMVAGAFAVHAAEPAHVALLAGALLFYVSDLTVARDRFVKNAFENRLVGLPLYYAGQVLMALAIATP